MYKRYHCHQIHVMSQSDSLVTTQHGLHCNIANSLVKLAWVVMHSAVNHDVGNDDVTSWV